MLIRGEHLGRLRKSEFQYFEMACAAASARRTVLLVIDEATALARSESGRTLIDQIAVLRELADTGIFRVVMVSTFDILHDLRRAGVLDRRLATVVFPRYPEFLVPGVGNGAVDEDEQGRRCCSEQCVVRCLFRVCHDAHVPVAPDRAVRIRCRAARDAVSRLLGLHGVGLRLVFRARSLSVSIPAMSLLAGITSRVLRCLSTGVGTSLSRLALPRPSCRCSVICVWIFPRTSCTRSGLCAGTMSEWRLWPVLRPVVKPCRLRFHLQGRRRTRRGSGSGRSVPVSPIPEPWSSREPLGVVRRNPDRSRNGRS